MDRALRGAWTTRAPIRELILPKGDDLLKSSFIWPWKVEEGRGRKEGGRVPSTSWAGADITTSPCPHSPLTGSGYPHLTDERLSFHFFFFLSEVTQLVGSGARSQPCTCLGSGTPPQGNRHHILHPEQPGSSWELGPQKRGTWAEADCALDWGRADVKGQVDVEVWSHRCRNLVLAVPL